ncbi:MAG TPA: hypothetical protein VFT08_06400 [Pyrinomonadaceae bacterium]|nr:hypothetical protein [Pyrinomonadaceae bacterium]
MYSKSINAIISAVRTLFSNRRSLLLIVAVYTGLLAVIYLFVSTREATISQLLLTLITVIAAPALFFVLQAAIVSSHNLIKNALKLIVVSVPVIGLTVLAVYGLNKLETHPTIVTTVRYLLLAVIVPLLVIQLWITVTNGRMRVRNVLANAFAPQSVFVYACGFLIFAVVPYLLLHKTMSSSRPWLELSLLVGRLGLSALLILLGWVLTVRALSILNCRGGTPWPPQSYEEGLLRRRGGHRVPPLQSNNRA